MYRTRRGLVFGKFTIKFPDSSVLCITESVQVREEWTLQSFVTLANSKNPIEYILVVEKVCEYQNLKNRFASFSHVMIQNNVCDCRKLCSKHWCNVITSRPGDLSS